MNKHSPSAQHIFIIGESSLVEEYGALCEEKGLRVTARRNPGEKGAPQKDPKSPLPRDVMIALELTNVHAGIKKNNLISLDRSLPPAALIMSSSVTVTITEQSSWVKHPQRLIGIGALPSLLGGQMIELARAPATDEREVVRTKEFIASLGKESAVVQDSIGLVMPRILCMLANEAYFAMMEGVAAGDDIDTAMKLGTNYPAGPVERAGKIGLGQVYAVLAALQSHFGEDRYRTAPMLRQAAMVDG